MKSGAMCVMIHFMKDMALDALISFECEGCVD